LHAGAREGHPHEALVAPPREHEERVLWGAQVIQPLFKSLQRP
jgi:hypothetical protein